MVADDIYGPYLPIDNMRIMPGCSEDYAHVTQTGFFYTLRSTENKETVLYCGDRWCDFAGNGWGYNQWVPLSFDRETPYFNSLHSWHLDAKSGAWRVARDNNYVRNGSFEADRRPIPCPRKPVQGYLLGWNTEVFSGNRVVVGDDMSPILNYENSAEDRAKVIGEKSMYISDNVDFERIITQQITSTPYVSLPDGVYQMSARVKNNSFTKFEMFAESAGKRFSQLIEGENPDWVTMKIKGVRVRDGYVQIGFKVIGCAGAWACIDDVSFVRQ